jgi:hypothetical protein
MTKYRIKLTNMNERNNMMAILACASTRVFYPLSNRVAI